MERLLPWLSEKRPEIVCLQETKCVDEAFPREPIEELGYSLVTFGQRTYNGVAILAKGGIEDVIRGFGDERFDDEARVIGATVEDVMVLNLYVVNGQSVGSESYDFKLSWLERLRDFVRERYDLAEKVVLLGDYNVTIDDRDVHDPELWKGRILCSAPERAALQALMAEGYSDPLRKFTEEAGHHTWWDFRTRGFQRGRGLRIDHALLSPPALEACTAFEVDREARDGAKPSDHAPVIVTLD